MPEREDGDGDGKKRRDWKQHCRNLYNRCIEEDWLGTWTCHDCFRYCEGQQGNWPSNRCLEP
jgi:hypothetical protein